MLFQKTSEGYTAFQKAIGVTERDKEILIHVNLPNSRGYTDMKQGKIKPEDLHVLLLSVR